MTSVNFTVTDELAILADVVGVVAVLMDGQTRRLDTVILHSYGSHLEWLQPYRPDPNEGMARLWAREGE